MDFYACVLMLGMGGTVFSLLAFDFVRLVCRLDEIPRGIGSALLTWDWGGMMCV